MQPASRSQSSGKLAGEHHGLRSRLAGRLRIIRAVANYQTISSLQARLVHRGEKISGWGLDFSASSDDVSASAGSEMPANSLHFSSSSPFADDTASAIFRPSARMR